MNFKEITEEAPCLEWCVVECPNYTPSGFHIAQYNNGVWEDENGEDITHYVEGWHVI